MIETDTEVSAGPTDTGIAKKMHHCKALEISLMSHLLIVKESTLPKLLEALSDTSTVKFLQGDNFFFYCLMFVTAGFSS